MKNVMQDFNINKRDYLLNYNPCVVLPDQSHPEVGYVSSKFPGRKKEPNKEVAPTAHVTFASFHEFFSKSRGNTTEVTLCYTSCFEVEEELKL